MPTTLHTFIRFLFFLSLLTHKVLMHAECAQLPPEGISPFFSFEYAILPKHSFVVSEELLFIKQKFHSALVSFTEAYYGLTHNLTLVTLLPIFSQTPLQGPGEKTGLGDLLLQADYRFYKNETDEYRYRIIGSAGVQLPTSTVTEQNLFTFNTTSFFLGITQDATTRNWYFYSNFAALINTKHNHLKFGTILNYNMGIGKIFCLKDTFITIFAELSDFYSRPDRLNNIPDLTTGENYLFFGPSLRFKHKAFLVQGGIQFVVSHIARIKPLNKIKFTTGIFASYFF